MRKGLRVVLCAVLMLAVITGTVGCGSPAARPAAPTKESSRSPTSPPVAKAAEPTPSEQPKQIPAPAIIEGEIKVHFIDVGQGDSILVQIPGLGNMLVDAGEAVMGPRVTSYLKAQGVQEIGWLVATHPHEDHIGGMVEVMKAFPVKNVHMPRTTHTTQIYENLLLTIKDKGLTITEARVGRTIVEATNLRAVFAAPCGSGYDNLNDWSAVIRLDYGETSFLFAGDAEAQSQGEMLLSSIVSPKTDVLKVPHHGSSNGLSSQFLSLVAPKYAVISVGAGNSYGHPASQTLARLSAAKVTTYRTDQHGNVVFTSDGKDLAIKTAKTDQTTTGASPSTWLCRDQVNTTGYTETRGRLPQRRGDRGGAPPATCQNPDQLRRRRFSGSRTCDTP